MLTVLAALSFGLALLALGVVAAQVCALHAHLAGEPRQRRTAQPISILKPLCGIDDDLEANLESFAALDYPDFEVVLGVRDTSDPAYAVACRAARRRPDVFRVALQRGAPGLNPKVNQLLTLAVAARHDIFVISDSNVRVAPDYLDEIAAELADPSVGLVTHLIAADGERRLGARLDNLQLCCGTSPSVAAAKRLAAEDVVVGKSMAMKRSDVAALGGFSVVKDVLAEDFVLGRLVGGALGKRVVVARRPIVNVSRDRGLRAFLSRYERWSVIQRSAVGAAVHSLQVLFNPVPLAVAGALLRPSFTTLVAAVAIATAKWSMDGLAIRLLRPGQGNLRLLAAAPLRDALMVWVLAYGLFSSRVEWRGNRLRVLSGTRLAMPQPVLAPEGAEAAELA